MFGARGVHTGYNSSKNILHTKFSGISVTASSTKVGAATPAQREVDTSGRGGVLDAPAHSNIMTLPKSSLSQASEWTHTSSKDVFIAIAPEWRWQVCGIYQVFLSAGLQGNTMNGHLQAEHTAADYYFDSYAHFGEVLPPAVRPLLSIFTL